MKVIWTTQNAEHIARHGIAQKTVEAVFEAEDAAIIAGQPKGRWIVEGTVGGALAGRLHAVGSRRGLPHHRAPDTAQEESMRKPKVYRSVSELPPVYVPVAEVEKGFGREAAAADRRYGPHVAALVPRGRPRRGTTVEKTASHSVRMAESVWSAARAKAETLGITTNAAVQLAVMEWTGSRAR